MNHPSIYLRGTCRACQSPLEEVLNLGNLRLNAFPHHLWEIDQVHRVPLVLTVCKGCGLCQLDRTVPQDWMYRHYWYRSGVNESMIAELRSIVEEAWALVPAVEYVLDIGANDGTLLMQYRRGGATPARYAVEPALNLQEDLRYHADVVIPDYFPLTNSSHLPPFQIITAIAMAYDLEDPVRFFQSIHDLLAPGGVAVVQFQDLGQQLASAAFDTICHEHLEYYSLWALTHIFRRVGLTIQRVVETPINGGSLRLFLRRQLDCIPAELSVGLQMVHEAKQGLDTPTLREGKLDAFVAFRNRVEAVKTQVRAALETAWEQGAVVDILGASTKGNILLQVLDVGPKQARQAIDRSPQKAGLLTITGIPIVGEEQGRKEPADLWLSPIWQFRESVLRREEWYLKQGGTILFPFPQVEVVKASWKPLD